MNDKNVTVVTITYNNFLELKKTLDSLTSVKCVSSLVINGGSSLDTLEYLKYSNLNNISEPDHGISDAFTKGAHNAQSEFVTFLNSGDELIDKNYYTEAIKLFNEDNNLDYIYASIIINHSRHGKMLVTPNHKRDFTKIPFPHPSLIVRKNVFNKIGYFNLNLKIAMDYDFAIRLITSNLNGFYYKKKPVVLMDGSGISSNNGILGQKERILILKRQKCFDLFTAIYHYKLLFKLHARELLDHLGIIHFYDQLKPKTVKPE